MQSTSKSPVIAAAVMLAAVVVATGNISRLAGGHPFLYDATALPRLVLAAVGIFVVIGLWSWLAARQGAISIKTDVVLWLLLALAAWSVVAAAMADDPHFSILGQSERLEGVVTMWLLASVYFGFLQVVHRVSDIGRIAVPLTAAATLLALHGLGQFAGFDLLDTFQSAKGFALGQVSSTLGNPNFLASLLVLVLPIAVALSIESEDTRGSVLWGTASAVIAGTILATYTRSAWVAVLVEAAVLVYAVRRGRPEGARRLLWLGAAAIAAMAVIGVASAAAGRSDTVASRVAETATLTGSASERMELTRVALASIKDSPVLGVGPDAFLSTFRTHRTDAYAQAYTADATLNNAHSWPIQYATTLGLPGGAMLLAALVLGMTRSRRAVSADTLKRAGLMAGAVWIGCLGYSVSLLANVAVVGATVPFFALLAAINAPSAGTTPLPLGAARFGAAAAFTLAAISLAVGGVLITADSQYFRSRDAYHAGDHRGALALASSAARLNPTSVKYARGAAQSAAALVTDAIDRGDPQPEVTAAYERANASFARLLERHPRDYAGLAWLGALQARAGQYLDDAELLESAQATALRAASLDRQHAGVAGLSQGRIDTAEIIKAETVPALP